ncbi:MAG: TIR domain-containing protein, partial [Candidatus Sabulitectum sp.]|nr:TIR domain-containing protein [Candidatus Sabulitectum sp.]
MFISHSSKDEGLAAGVVQHLLSLGVSCWIAPGDIPPGEDWAESVLQAIDGALCLLLVATVSSFQSGQVRREIERAADRGIPILAVVFDGAAIPDWLKYHVNEENFLFFNRHGIADAALRVMLKLQENPVCYSDVLRAGNFFESTDFPEHLQKVKGEDSHWLFSGERRPVYVLWVRLGDEISIGSQTLILSSVERLFQKAGAVRVPLAFSGVLYVFDGLGVENSLETVIGCGIALEGYLNNTGLKSVENRVNVSAGIGLSAGVAVSSSVSDLIDEIKDAVNEARGLAEVSERKLLVSAGIQRRFGYARNFIELTSNVFCVQEYGDSSQERGFHQSIAMVGRENELSLLVAAAKELNTAVCEPGLGCSPLKVIGISGGRGLGKTRLVREFAEELKPEAEIAVFVGQANDSFWKHDGLLDSLLRNIQTVINESTGFSGTDSSGSAGIFERLRLLLNRDEHGCATEPAVGELDGWRGSLVTLLKSVAFINPMVVVLEDVNRADSSSIETLRTVLGAHYINARILFVLTYSDFAGDMVNPISFSTLDDVSFHEMELNPLNTDDSEKLITLLLQRAGSRSVDTGVMQLLIRLGSGSPLFLKQLVDHVVEQNLLNSHNRELCRIDEYEFLAPAMEAA